MRRVYVGILPPEHVTERILEMRRELGFSTDNPVHLTLRSSFFLDRYDAFVHDLKQMLADRDPFEVSLDGWDRFDGCYLVLTARKDPVLLELGADIVQLAQSYRFGAPGAIEGQRTGTQKRYFDEYGDAFVFEHYTPHVTVSYRSTPGDERTMSTLPIRFTAERIGVVDKTDRIIVRDEILLR